MRYTRFACFFDFISLITAVYIGFAMRLSFYFPTENVKDFFKISITFTVIVMAVLFFGRIYKIIWSMASIEEYSRLVLFYCAGVMLFIILHLMIRVASMPRTSMLIWILLSAVFMIAWRAIMRTVYIERAKNKSANHRAVIVGAGDAGTSIARSMMRKGSDTVPVAFIDDNPALLGLEVASLKIMGTRENLHEVIKKCEADTVLIAIPSASGENIKAYLDSLDGENVNVRVLPSILNIANGHVDVNYLREVRLEDLLRRPSIELDNKNINDIISGCRVLVTGAGGSIGSEVCRQVLARNPERLIVLGHGEQSIYMLLEKFDDAGIKIPVVPIIADVADEETMRMIFEREKPEIVFHAGAHKHVPLMEYNQREALRVNSLGTYNIAALAGEYGVKRFVMISTDKAVHPSSVMGATKRVAERLLLSVQKKFPDTKYMAVRFGNVLGSRGSVVPKFERQIAAGGPVTVTHPDMKRYFMLIPEAVSLVLQAGSMGNGGELFVLDMGEPVKISEMAEMLIKLHGYEPYKDIKIEFTGIRPGEKLYEELFYDSAHVDKTTHTKIFKTQLTPDNESILPKVQEILKESEAGKLEGRELRDSIIALGVEADG